MSCFTLFVVFDHTVPKRESTTVPSTTTPAGKETSRLTTHHVSRLTTSAYAAISSGPLNDDVRWVVMFRYHSPYVLCDGMVLSATEPKGYPGRLGKLIAHRLS